jgi:hypothetical protein
MKPPGSFNRSNRLLSHLRIGAVVTLIAAAVVSAIASFTPDLPNAEVNQVLNGPFPKNN